METQQRADLETKRGAGAISGDKRHDTHPQLRKELKLRGCRFHNLLDFRDFCIYNYILYRDYTIEIE